MSERPIPIPPHVLRPGDPARFVPQAKHVPTKTCGLGYAVLRALGAHDRLRAAALDTIQAWADDYSLKHKITPHSSELDGEAFADRVGPRFAADRAASNAACYPGGRQGRPSYRQVFEEVWVQQKWPSLCRALGGL